VHAAEQGDAAAVDDGADPLLAQQGVLSMEMPPGRGMNLLWSFWVSLGALRAMMRQWRTLRPS
jgi:hypothetical protein